MVQLYLTCYDISSEIHVWRFRAFCLNLPILGTFKDFSEEKKFIFYKASGQIKNRWPLGVLFSTWLFRNIFWYFLSFFWKIRNLTVKKV